MTRTEILEEVVKRLLDPNALRTAVMMSGAHLSHAQAMLLIEDDRFGAQAALDAIESHNAYDTRDSGDNSWQP